MDDNRALALQLAMTTLGESVSGPNEVLSVAQAYLDFLQGKNPVGRFLIKARLGRAGEDVAGPGTPPNSEPRAARSEFDSPDGALPA